MGGFVGGLWARGGQEAMTWGWAGGWRRWRSDGQGIEHWEEAAAISGHNGPVKGLDWSPKGEYLISAGSVFAKSSWVRIINTLEVSIRPHGYTEPYQINVKVLQNLGTKSVVHKCMATTFWMLHSSML